MQVPQAVNGWLEGQHRVLFTMWETDEMPAAFKPWLKQFDQILVPCDFNVGLFSEFHDSVQKVPLGVDLAFWCLEPKPTNATTFRFHAGGSLWKRKGLDLVVQAFKVLGIPNTELHIKAAPHAFDTPEKIDVPNVFLHRDWMHPKTQRDWYNLADCFVAPARGEGFGLMPLQAIAMGIPTIVSASSGQNEFTHLATHVVSCRKSGAETCGKWDEPSLDELIAAMRDVYENRPERVRPIGVKQFDWSVSAKKLVAAIPKGTLLDDPVWVAPDIKVRVKARRFVNAIINNETYRFREGETAGVPTGVYQVLSDSGAVEMEPW